jgi:type IV pilus assembly protein PilX
MNAAPHDRTKQQGAALVVGLVLLVVLTILAISGVVTATMEMRMAGNTQLQERAFQAAEVGIEEALANPIISTSGSEVQNFTANPNSPGDEYSFTLQYVCTSALGMAATGSSIGTSFSAYHFQVDAAGRTTAGNAQAQHVQGFYVMGPQGSEDC